jgi:hypothetical protein
MMSVGSEAVFSTGSLILNVILGVWAGDVCVDVGVDLLFSLASNLGRLMVSFFLGGFDEGDVGDMGWFFGDDE